MVKEHQIDCVDELTGWRVTWTKFHTQSSADNHTKNSGNNSDDSVNQRDPWIWNKIGPLIQGKLLKINEYLLVVRVGIIAYNFSTKIDKLRTPNTNGTYNKNQGDWSASRVHKTPTAKILKVGISWNIFGGWK